MNNIKDVLYLIALKFFYVRNLVDFRIGKPEKVSKYRDDDLDISESSILIDKTDEHKKGWENLSKQIRDINIFSHPDSDVHYIDNSEKNTIAITTSVIGRVFSVSHDVVCKSEATDEKIELIITSLPDNIISGFYRVEVEDLGKQIQIKYVKAQYFNSWIMKAFMQKEATDANVESVKNTLNMLKNFYLNP